MDTDFKDFLSQQFKDSPEEPKNDVDVLIDEVPTGEDELETIEAQEEEEETEEETEEEQEQEEPVYDEPEDEEPVKKTSKEKKKESPEEVLRRRVAELTSELEKAKNGEPLDDDPAKSDARDEDALSFLDDYSDAQIQEAMSNPALMRDFLKTSLVKVRRQAIEDAVGVATVTTTRNLELKSVIQSFYQENNDLLPYKEMLGFTVNKVQSENPGWNVTNILKESAKRLRKELLISKRVTDVRDKRTPAFPSKQKGAGTVGTTKPTGQQREIVDMFKSLK